MSGGLRITDAAARAIAVEHEDAAAAIAGSSRSLPLCGIDGGEAAGILTEIIGRVVGNCAALARANQSAAAIMREVAADYAASEEKVAEQFHRIAVDVDEAAATGRDG